MGVEMDTPIQKGTVIMTKFPFYLGQHETRMEDAWDVRQVWIPGCNSVRSEPDDFELVAHGMGAIVLSVVDAFKPGKYPERVFYTRSWIDPDGNEFGKNKLHITTMQTFKRRAKGYFHEYRLEA